MKMAQVIHQWTEEIIQVSPPVFIDSWKLEDFIISLTNQTPINIVALRNKIKDDDGRSKKYVNEHEKSS